MTSPNSDTKSWSHVIPVTCFTVAAALAVSASAAVAKTDQSIIPEASTRGRISSSEPPAQCWKVVKNITYVHTLSLPTIKHGGAHNHGHHHWRRHHHKYHPHIKALLEHKAKAQKRRELAGAETDKMRKRLGRNLMSELTTTRIVPQECPVSAPVAGGGGTGGGGVSPISSNPIPSQTVVPPVTVPESGSSSTGNTTPTYPTYNCDDDLLNGCGGGDNGGGLDIPPPPPGWWPPGGGSGGWPTGGGSISAAPEPDAWALIMAGVGVAGLALRRRPKNLRKSNAGQALGS